MGGWVKIHRKIFENPSISKDAETLAIWVWILCHAEHEGKREIFGGKEIALEAGQLVATTKRISDDLHVSTNKVSRVLKKFESDNQIEKQSSNKNTLITVVSWDEYQGGDKQVGFPVENQWITSGKPMDNQWKTTQKRKKEAKKEKIKNQEGEEEKNNTPLYPPTGKDDAKEPESQQEAINRLLLEFPISDFLLGSLNDWLEYKKERKFVYKGTGLRGLIKKISQSAEAYGDAAVADIIDGSISSGYQGITWDSLDKIKRFGRDSPKVENQWPDENKSEEVEELVGDDWMDV